MNYGTWSAREAHACVKALIVHGAALFEDDIVWTEAWKRCAWPKMKDAIGTREIPQIQELVRRRGAALYRDVARGATRHLH